MVGSGIIVQRTMSSTPTTWSRVSHTSQGHPAQAPLPPPIVPPATGPSAPVTPLVPGTKRSAGVTPQVPKQAKLSRRSSNKPPGLAQCSTQAAPSPAFSTNQPTPSQALSPYVGAGGVGLPVSVLPPCRGLLICQRNQGCATHRDPSPMFLGLPLMRTCGQLTTFSLGRMSGLSQVLSF